MYFKVKYRLFLEYLEVIKKYYKNPLFRKVDFHLRLAYLFQNPFRMHKKFMEKKGEEDLYSYGETPLTTMELVAKECNITKNDIVYELGSGRGLVCFWLSIFIGCKVVGIEYFSKFIDIANQIGKKYHLKNICFYKKKIEESDLKQATVVYFYGSKAEDALIESVIKKLPKNAKIITVSYSLADYSSNIKNIKSFSAPFTWGKARVYLQEVS